MKTHALFLFLSIDSILAAPAAEALAPAQIPPAQYARTEASTNVVLSTGTPQDNIWRFSIRLEASPANNVQVEFGTDLDGDGILSPCESSLIAGWDCGEWFLRDKRGGILMRSPGPDGIRRMGWRMHLDSNRIAGSFDCDEFQIDCPATLFDKDWDMARIVVRGAGVADEEIVSKIFVNPFRVVIR